MLKKLCSVLSLCAAVAIVLVLAFGVAQAQTATSTKTTKLSGTVVSVEGPYLLVKMASGDAAVFTPPADRKFIIDGKELTLAELQPGTKLNATVTETTTSITDRTVESLEGTVWYVSAPTVILTLPNGENHKYIVAHDSPVKFFDKEGKERSISDLRKKMVVKATKITESERMEFASDTQVTGTAPQAAAAPAPAAAPAATEAPAMPKTGSSLPLIGQLGLLFICSAIAIRRFLL